MIVAKLPIWQPKKSIPTLVNRIKSLHCPVQYKYCNIYCKCNYEYYDYIGNLIELFNEEI